MSRGNLLCWVFFIDVLETSKYHCVCVCCAKHAFKYMIMCNSNFDHNYLINKIFQPANDYVPLISNTLYILYIIL